MDFTQLFLQRHDVLHDFFLEDYWKTVPEDLMRNRPHPGINSIFLDLVAPHPRGRRRSEPVCHRRRPNIR